MNEPELKTPALKLLPTPPAPPHPLAGPFDEVTDAERGMLDRVEAIFNSDPGVRQTYLKVENFACHCLASRRGTLA